MANFKPNHLYKIRHRHPGYQDVHVFVEIGTYLAVSTEIAHRQFPIVHSVEISEALHKRAVALHGALPGVHFHCGDSRTFVARMAKEIAEPAMWYLDAHWFPKTKEPVGGKAEGLPLWEELNVLAQRPAGDVVIVDDTHAFGTAVPTPEWVGVTLETIAALFPGNKEAVILGDQAVIYR